MANGDGKITLQHLLAFGWLMILGSFYKGNETIKPTKKISIF